MASASLKRRLLRPLRAGEHLEDRIESQLADMAARPDLIRPFCRHPSVAYIADCRANEHGLPRLRALTGNYVDLPMDLADASLVLLAEQTGVGRILSTDQRNFRTCRFKQRKPFRNLLLD